MAELGLTPSVTAIAAHYQGLVTGLMIDTVDAALAAEIEATGMRVRTAPILMRDAQDRRRIAAECIAFAKELAP
jgi:LPPG:FO 2-phospho-L-lactate transferase